MQRRCSGSTPARWHDRPITHELKECQRRRLQSIIIDTEDLISETIRPRCSISRQVLQNTLKFRLEKGKSGLLVVADTVRRRRDASACKLWLLQDEAQTDDGTSLRWQRQASRHAAPSTVPLRDAGGLMLIGNGRRVGPN